MKFIGFIFGIMLTVFGFWTNGYDFDIRGDTATFLFISAICFGTIFSFIFDIFKE